MTHVPVTGAINRLHFSGAGFWYVRHAHNGTGFVWYQNSAPIRTQKVACTWLKWRLMIGWR